VEQTEFNAIEQNFYVAEPVFSHKPESKLGGYIRKTLGIMWNNYANVYEEKKPFVHWTVKTQVDQSGGEYKIKITLMEIKKFSGFENFSFVQNNRLITINF
tara:strand:- start:170 stop:472 length:303 start_codon:yes stop_codon:yes gene_type:complete